MTSGKSPGNRMGRGGPDNLHDMPRKQEIMAAAAKVFARKGFKGATTSEIAREAGVAEGTIFRYFKTKKDLLVDVAGSLAVETLKGIMSEMSAKSDEESLKSLIYNRLELIRPNLDLVKVMFYEAQFHPEVRQMIFGRVIFEAAQMLSEYFEARVKMGIFRDVDPFAAVRSLVGAVFTYIMFDSVLKTANPAWEDSDPQEARDRRNVDLIVDIFLNGVRATREVPGGLPGKPDAGGI